MSSITSMLTEPTQAPTSPPLAEEQEKYSSLALFVVLALLIGSFWTSYYLKIKRITAIHETIVGLFAGMFVGAVLRIGPGEQVQKMLSFSNTIMLNVLLPPIILASGYDLRQENFFRNFGVILTFAFAGTFISSIVIGVIAYLWTLLRLESLNVTLLDCLIFGSTLSATDPVTILAIFNTYKVDPQLYSIIFGESLLNDAVSIVMFDVLSTFRHKHISVASIFHGFGLFIFIFTFSLALGVAFGLGCSLMLKHSRLSTYPPLETALVLLIAYTSYFFSNGVTMSGIVSLLFCGITLKHYAYHNMSRRTQRATRYIFQTLANLSENFIFIYLGLSLFTQDMLVYKPLFIIVTVAAVVASRYAAVFPIAGLVNMVKRARQRKRRRSGAGTIRSANSAEEELPREYQIMLFWAGLRGAVGFALSAGIEGQYAAALQTTVLVAVVLTVIVFGGTTAQMLEILGIRTGVEDDEGDSTDEEEEAEIAALRIRSMRNRRRSVARSGQNGRGKFAPESQSLYTDAEEGSALNHSGNASWQNGSQPVRDYVVDDDNSSSSTEVLPPKSTNTTLGGAVSGLRTQTEEFAVPPEEETNIKRFLDRAGLIMRDGRWFSTLDQRYLTPLFTNSVASRKHEERKAMRRGEAALASSMGTAETPSSGMGGISGTAWHQGGGMSSTSDLGPLGPLSERDADVVDEDDEDEGFVRPLNTSTSTTGFNNPSSGRQTPIRRAASRTGSTDDLPGTGSNPSSSRVTGAFSP
ncbi:sodium/hydrogen exchanger [Meira miltonrushii]|uniref:Sodium/hydrogen exchanger n=1 Tax=Meira miltonrushii TaxID=1280837 RepID=A0A316VFH8_9BASI|nr:sodium/hydrogen exchanger [Meira miltonrushii]PWN35818.1 sodium/hydrogen exchanger [Meira miltonrushii]